MPTTTPPASWWKTCSTPTPEKALGPFLPSGRRNGVIDGDWGCESIQLRSKRRDRHVGGRIELLVRAEIRFPPALPRMRWRINRNPPPHAGGREGQNFTRKEDLCFTASYSHSPLWHPPLHCGRPPRRWRSGKPARLTPRACVSMKSRIASASTDVWSAR